MAKSTQYPTLRKADGTLRNLTRRQQHDLNLLEDVAYAWAMAAPREVAHDRALRLFEEYRSLPLLEQIDLRGVSLLATRQGIMAAAKRRGWID